MNAEIISVGTELLLGAVVNTDAAIVARALSELGIDLLHTCVVGDNPARLKEAVETAIRRSDLLVMTGGLGPTTDDLTKETTAAAAGKQLTLHQPSLERIQNYFNEKRVSENQAKQAWLPEGCHVLQNDNGTAPGCAFQAENGCTIIMLPGPPSELAPMLHNYAVPYLKQSQEFTIVSHNVHIYGRGEAPVAQMMDDLMDGENPTLAPYANEGECYLRVTAKARTHQEADQLCQPLIDEIKRRLGGFVYSVDVDSLEALVVQLLGEQGKTLATAESCTGGLLSKRLTDISGSSAVFHMGVTTYANQAKEQLLGVPHETLEAHGAVSPETARAMAEGIVRASGSDLGVGITGIAGPEGGTPEKPVGLIYIALSDGKNTWVTKRSPIGRSKSREWHRHCAASQALDMVRRYLSGLPVVAEHQYEGDKASRG